MMVVSVDAGPTPVLGSPEALFDFSGYVSSSDHDYGVSAGTA